MDNTSLKLLLDRVRQIQVQYLKISALTGENFNVFQILNLGTSEVRLHSNFLAELLNPKGTHGQNDLYLQLFINLFEIKDFDTRSASVVVEEYAGPINQEYTSGGRIDIALTDGHNRQIFIENKIYAKDQKNQLLRYYNYKPSATLLYLTLCGDEPSKDSTAEKLSADKYRRISYKDDIRDWLTLCRKESVTIPIVRETITQYIHLINELTNQSERTAMNNEIRQLLINNPDLIDSVEQCAIELQSITKEKDAEFKKLLKEKFPHTEIVELAEGISIENFWGEDPDGFFIAYRAFQNKQNISHISNLEKYRGFLKEINNEFHLGGNWLGWINPRPFKRGQRFINLPKKESVCRRVEDIVSEIVEQDLKIRAQFISKIAAVAQQ
jgi:hypothetical protein